MADVMAGVQELMEQQIRQLEQIMELEDLLDEDEDEDEPHVITEDSRDLFVNLSDDEFLEQFRLPKSTVTDLIEEVRPRAWVPKIEEGTEWLIAAYWTIVSLFKMYCYISC